MVSVYMEKTERRNDSPGKQKHLQFIAAMQVFAMLLIVLSHSLPDYGEIPAFMTRTVPYLQGAGLVIFMWVSGFLTAYAGIHDTKIFLRKRFHRLIFPYVF